jgi:hypothetical protein
MNPAQGLTLSPTNSNTGEFLRKLHVLWPERYKNSQLLDTCVQRYRMYSCEEVLPQPLSIFVTSLFLPPEPHDYELTVSRAHPCYLILAIPYSSALYTLV